jgi:hypothetical protein
MSSSSCKAFFEPSKAFIYILGAVINGREDLEVWVGKETDTVCDTNNIINGFMSDTS